MIQINKNRVSITSEHSIELLRNEFEAKQCFVLPQLLAPVLRENIQRLHDSGHYIKDIHPNHAGGIIAEEFILNKSNVLLNFLFMLLNQTPFIEVIRHITNIEQINSFNGRIYKLDSSEHCYDTWHDDRKGRENNPRLAGLSLNISKTAYNGGHFIIKHKHSNEIYRDVSYKEWGTAHVFKIDKNLLHKVTRVEGQQSRIAYAGWFTSESGFL